MSVRNPCERFSERLDALADGLLSKEETSEVLEHAASCASCATMLSVHRHLSHISTDELESLVPDEFVDGMWSQVSERTGTTDSRPNRLARWRIGQQILVPLLGTMIVGLFIGSGLLGRKIKKLESRIELLTEQIGPSQLAASSSRSVAGTHPSGVSTPFDWTRFAQDQHPASVAEIRAVLTRLPADETVLSPLEAERLLDRLPFGSSWFRRVPLPDIDPADGIQAGEMIAWIDALGPEPDRKIPVARLLLLAEGRDS